MKQLLEKTYSRNLLLLLIIFSFFIGLAFLSINFIHFIKKDTPQEASIHNESAALEETIDLQNTKQDLKKTQNPIFLENNSKVESISKKDSGESEKPDSKVIVEPPKEKAKIIKEVKPNQTITKLILANTEARKKKIRKFLKEKKKLYLIKQTMIDRKQLELNSIPDGEKRDVMLKAQGERVIELVLIEKSIKSREALLNKLNQKTAQYGYSNM